MTTRRFYQGVLILCLTGVAFGCADSINSPLGPGGSASAKSSGQELPETGPVGINGLFLRISDQLPSFAGLFVGPSGRLTVLLQDQRDQEAAPDVLRSFLSARTPALQLDHFNFAPARFSFRELWSYRLRLTPILNRHGANGVGVHSSSNQIIVDSPNSTADLLLAADIAAEGIPSGAIRIRRAAEIPVTELTDWFYDSIPAGVGILLPMGSGFYHACTLGANAKRGTETLFIIASHCTRNFAVVDGDAVHQGSLDAGARIGYEAYDAAWLTGSICYGATYCRYSDAALISWNPYFSSRKPHFGRIATTTLRGENYNITWSGESNNREIVSQWDTQPFQGEIIDRVGATTGWAYGEVEQPAHDIQLEDGRWLVAQTVVLGGGAQGGDSGGPAFSLLPGNDAMFAGVVRSAYIVDRQSVGFVFSSISNILVDYPHADNLLFY